MLAEYLLVAGISVFFLTLLNRLQATIASVKISSWVLDASVGATLPASIWLLGMRQFGGYDHSALVEASWLQLSSLVPFKDYPSTFPPLFFVGGKYAFLLFGIHWSAFVLLMAAFAVFSFLFLSRQFRALGFPALGTTILAFTAEMGTTVVCSYWWHNAITSVIVVAVFISSLVCLISSDEWTSWVLLGISFTLLLLSKPNAWPVGACVLLLCVTHGASQWKRASMVLGVGVAAAAVFCWINRLSPLGVLRTYYALSETRGNLLNRIALFDFGSMEGRILLRSTALIVLLFLAVLVNNRGELRLHWRAYSCCLLAAFTSLVMVRMNNELKTSDLMPLVVALAVVAYRPWSAQRLEGIGRASVIVIVLFMTLCMYWAATRMRVRGIGERTFFENVPAERIKTGFFEGLHSGPRLIEVLREIESTLNTYPSKKVFFGPRIEFSYAAFRRDPPPGLPIWWHPGTSYAVRDIAGVSQALAKDDFDLMIFLKDDRTRMPLWTLQPKLTLYSKVAGFSELDVYVKKGGM
jgi:hypothetical protein